MNVMDYIIKMINSFAEKPEYGTDQYSEWIKQEDFINLLKTLPDLDEIVLYASVSDVFMHGILVPKRLVSPPNIDDLGKWNCNPSSSWGIVIDCGKRTKISIAPPLDHTGSDILDKGEQIIFARQFDGRQDRQYYIELSQKFTHSLDLHYVSEREAFCKFNERGDIINVINISRLPGLPDRREGRVVTILRSSLDEYMAITGSVLVLTYDSARYDPSYFSGWSNQEVEYYQEQPEIYYHMGLNPGNGSYLRGFQIIRPVLSKKDIISKYGISKKNKRQYATFITLDWKNKKVCECSCDPKKLGNYVVKSEYPFEISPVFFRPEVLQKYKADTEKYKIEHRSISCRHAWHLQSYDVNEAGQVHTYLKYLSYLPYEEQLYWKSFNEPPKGNISRRAYMTDFEGRWDQDYDPLLSLLNVLRELYNANVPWWKLPEEKILEDVHYPVTESADEWIRELHSLHKLIVEGFVVKELRIMAIKCGRKIDTQWKSIKLIDEIFIGKEIEINQAAEIINPLKELNYLRSKLAGHTSGREAVKIKEDILLKNNTFPLHYRQLCEKCDVAIRALKPILEID